MLIPVIQTSSMDTRCVIKILSILKSKRMCLSEILSMESLTLLLNTSCDSDDPFDI